MSGFDFFGPFVQVGHEFPMIDDHYFCYIMYHEGTNIKCTAQILI